ncbi:DUF2092 domain-containing protein [Streptomyces sp. RFCAC02]|uniref:LolA family protein n=1 Tax=Streptomyces sp. RFCAC02 TaxID=2499143 RepID=UPI00101EEB97|nr:DUF2092 domain-containing protein [Streptomyces sp. RFCAC02]
MAARKGIGRVVVPAALAAGAAAVGVGVWPALADEGGPDLPEVTAEELVVRVAESDTARLTGTVRIDAGGVLPDAGGMLERALGSLDGPAGRLAALASGESTLQVAVDGPERQRVALEDGGDELVVIHDGPDLWVHDTAGDLVLHGEVPEEAAEDRTEGGDLFRELTPAEAAEQLLADARQHADVTVDGTARVAGRDAYNLLVEPHGTEGGPTAARVAVDAETGVPLAVTVEGSDGQSFDVAFSRIEYSAPAGSAFEFTPPEDARVIELGDDPAALDGLLTDGLADADGFLTEKLFPEGLPFVLPDELPESVTG